MATIYESCTPILDSFGYHLARGDFYELCQQDVTNSNILRVLEVDTNHRIQALRQKFGIPADQLPSEEDLWLDKPSGRRMEQRTIHSRSKSIYATFCENNDPWLVKKGFVKQRLVARVDNPNCLQAEPAAPVFQDHQGRLFLIVDNEVGEYWGKDRKIHNALQEGWQELIRQVLYCIDAINAGLATLVGRKAPPKSKRHRPVAVKKVRLRRGGGLNTVRETKTTTSSTKAQTARSSNSIAAQGGSKNPATSKQNNLCPDKQYRAQSDECPELDTSTVPSDTARSVLGSRVQEVSQIGQRKLSKTGQGVSNSGQVPSNSGQEAAKTGHRRYREDITKDITLKISKKESALARLPLLSSKILIDDFRTAPWSAETILALSSKVLAVPDLQAIEESGNEELLAWYRTHWLEPAQRHIEKMRSLTPLEAWARTDLSTRFMATPGSPSWWQAIDGRKTKAPITFKNVADNFDVQYAEYLRHDWFPLEQTAYDGPSAYAQGYTGTSVPQSTAMPSEEPPGIVEAEITVAPTVIIEETAPPSPAPTASATPRTGWRLSAARKFVERMLGECPAICTRLAEIGPERVTLEVEYALGQWLEIRDPGDWYFPAPELRPHIDAAKALYDPQRNAAKSSDYQETSLPNTGPLVAVAAMSA